MPTATIRTRQCTNKHFFEDLGGGHHRLEMVLVSGGTFTMGSPETEEARQPSEGPQHEVTVPTFFMGRFPVTQAQWRQVSQFPSVNRDVDFKENPSHFSDKEDSDNRPVERVNWHEAKEFCSRLSQHTGRQYRLPTESEWEYACRGGTTTPFYCGNTITTEIANYYGNSYGKGPRGESRGETTPVDFFEMANPFCLCDMHGNVDEWCLDHWHNNYDGAPDDGSAWTEGGNSNSRVIRGGSWDVSPRNCRSALRYGNYADGRDSFIGFRVILVPR